MSGAGTRDAPHRPVEDPTLPVPGVPGLAEPLGPLDHPLDERLTGDQVFGIAGRRARVEGTAAGGVLLISADGVELARALQLEGAAGTQATRTPLGLERTVRVSGGVVVERVGVAREAPGSLVEWLSPEADADVQVEWTSGPARAWRRIERGVIVALDDGALAAFLFSAAPETLDIRTAAATGPHGVAVRARVHLAAGVPLRLAVAGGGSVGDAERGLAALDRPGSLTRARRGHADRLRRDRLSLEAPDGDAVRALEWAKHGLEARVGGEEAGGPAWARAVLDCLAAGALAEARGALTRPYPGPAAGEATWLHLLLVARYLAWTGDVATLRRLWPGVLVAWRAAGAGPGDGAGPLPGSALAELADAAESIGQAEAAGRLRESATARGGRAWSTETTGATPIARVVHGILGAEPDAARGRLVLRTVPPPGWDRFGVSGLRVGDAAVALEYQATGGRHAFRLAQQRGPAPLRVILEAALPGSRLLAATVDGVPAELDAGPGGDRLRVPVQVVLDHDRSVVLELER